MFLFLLFSKIILEHLKDHPKLVAVLTTVFIILLYSGVRKENNGTGIVVEVAFLVLMAHSLVTVYLNAVVLPTVLITISFFK
jgi:hypothetical protein